MTVCDVSEKVSGRGLRIESSPEDMGLRLLRQINGPFGLAAVAASCEGRHGNCSTILVVLRY